MKILEGTFKNWVIDEEEGVILDSEGNHYYRDEIRAIFYYRQLAKDFEGSRSQVLSLKKALEQRLENTEVEIEISVGGKSLLHRVRLQ